MRSPLPEALERGRVTKGEFSTTAASGPFGVFKIWGPCGKELRIVSSGAHDPFTGELIEDAKGWEHVSVSVAVRVPLWREMCFLKDLYWYPEDCVVQFHPPESQYVNNHARTLHLFRHISIPFPQPPAVMVGVPGIGEQTPEEARALYRMFNHGR